MSMPYRLWNLCVSCLAIAMALVATTQIARAEIDGHGPDSWGVTGVSNNDVLNARMGPGTSYPVIETFAHDERGLQLITCVPFYTMAHYSRMTEAEIDRLPARWCLMRSSDMGKAGWVAQRFLIADGYEPVGSPASETDAVAGNDVISEAQDVVRALYKAAASAGSRDTHPLNPAYALNYFSSDVVDIIRSRPIGADPIYGAQDFSGTVSEPKPDPDQPMLRGMVTITAEIVNFGRPHTAVFRLRADPAQSGAPIRIFRVEHDGWSFP